MRQTLAQKIRALLSQEESSTVSDDPGAAGDMDIASPPPNPDPPGRPAPAPEPAPEPEPEPEPEPAPAPAPAPAPEPAIPEADAPPSLIPDDYAGPVADQNAIRDGAVHKNMDNDNYEAWQPVGDPYKYEFFAGEGVEDSYFITTDTRSGKAYKVSGQKDPDMFLSIMEQSPSYKAEAAAVEEGRPDSGRTTEAPERYTGKVPHPWGDADAVNASGALVADADEASQVAGSILQYAAEKQIPYEQLLEAIKAKAEAEMGTGPLLEKGGE